LNELQKTFVAVKKAKNWLSQANCRNMDTELFFPKDGQNLSPFVKEVCAECPVQEKCFWYANESYSSMGIFAGTGARERQAWRTNNKVSLGMSKEDWEQSKYRGILRRPIGGAL
jgi:WhiB family redox-sensing transcriptional regulator